MKIAVTYENGQIFQHFGHTEQFKLYEAVDGKITHAKVVDTNGSGHGALAGFLMQHGVDTLVCGGIGGGAQAALAEAGIKLYGGVSGDADATEVWATIPMFTVTTMTMSTARLVTPAVTTAAASIAAIDMERTLTQLPFWLSLTEHEMETLRRSAFVRHYEKGAFVHSSDNECLGMMFVLSGEIRTYLLSEEGREVTLFRLYPGELCVLSASCVISQITFDTQMTAGMDTEVLIIPANVIAVLKEQNLHVRCFLYELATKRFSDVMWAMQQIMFKGLDRRLADFLLAEAERTGSDTIRMTHEQIAQHISSAREAVARMLKSFSEDGLVELRRGAITLRDTDGLNHLK